MGPQKILGGRLSWGFYICLGLPGPPNASSFSRFETHFSVLTFMSSSAEMRFSTSPTLGSVLQLFQRVSISPDTSAVNVAVALIIAGLKTSVTALPSCVLSVLLAVTFLFSCVFFADFEAILTKASPQKFSNDISYILQVFFIELGWVRHQFQDTFASTKRELTPNAATRSASPEVPHKILFLWIFCFLIFSALQSPSLFSTSPALPDELIITLNDLLSFLMTGFLASHLSVFTVRISFIGIKFIQVQVFTFIEHCKLQTKWL